MHISEQPRGVCPPSNIGAIPPTREVLREGQEDRSPSLPPWSANEIFVEHNWTSAVKIYVVLLVNYFQN